MAIFSNNKKPIPEIEPNPQTNQKTTNQISEYPQKPSIQNTNQPINLPQEQNQNINPPQQFNQNMQPQEPKDIPQLPEISDSPKTIKEPGFPEPSITNENNFQQNQIQDPLINQTPKQSILEQEDIPSITPELNYDQHNTNNLDQPFFVRIDKFNETKQNFENIIKRVTEMEKILQSLETVKEEEEKEIEQWKENVNEMKSYLSKIDKEIFDKI